MGERIREGEEEERIIDGEGERIRDGEEERGEVD